MEQTNRITFDPNIMGGKACIRGMRVTVGKPNANDETILALTYADGPSVLQVRTQNVSPDYLLTFVQSALEEHQELLERGALIVVDEFRSRSRILPLQLHQ